MFPSTNNMQGEPLLVCTSVCGHTQQRRAWRVPPTQCVSISRLCLESKADVGRMQTSPTAGETLTDILIDLNMDFTCRLELLLCTVSRRAGLFYTLGHVGRLVPDYCWISAVECVCVDWTRWGHYCSGCEIASRKIKVSIESTSR